MGFLFEKIFDWFIHYKRGNDMMMKDVLNAIDNPMEKDVRHVMNLLFFMHQQKVTYIFFLLVCEK